MWPCSLQRLRVTTPLALLKTLDSRRCLCPTLSAETSVCDCFVFLHSSIPIVACHQVGINYFLFCLVCTVLRLTHAVTIWVDIGLAGWKSNVPFDAIVHWIDFDGKEQPAILLPAGMTETVGTFSGHVGYNVDVGVTTLVSHVHVRSAFHVPPLSHHHDCTHTVTHTHICPLFPHFVSGGHL